MPARCQLLSGASPSPTHTLPHRPPPHATAFSIGRRFIKQEAEEKAAEIAVAAEEEFNITRLQLLEAEKARVRREFERREGTIEVKKKVRWAGGVWRGEVEWGGRVSGGCSPRACLLAVRFACTPPIPPPAAAAYLAGPCRWSTASS